MQIIKTAPTHTDINCSLSMTGITILKEGKYRQRHTGMKNFVQDGGSQIIKKPKNVPVKKKVKCSKNVTVNQDPCSNLSTDKPKKIRFYTINKKQVTHRIRGFVNQMAGEKRLFFWTVTFPVGTSDEIAHMLMNKWLTRLRTEKMLRSYLWVTERQENGTIHFHMAINQRLCIKKSNRYMRACIMYCINDGSLSWDRYSAVKYNGVDIAKNRKTKRVTNFAEKKSQKSLVSYLTKYISKNNTEFGKLAWHCSRDYSNLIIAVNFSIEELAASNIRLFVSPGALFETEFYSFYKWKDDPPATMLSYLAQINQHVLSLLN